MNPSTALATVLVRALCDLGVRHVVLCPGSRSAPLAYVLAEREAEGRLWLHVRIDERSAGFLALGLAKEHAQPVAVVTTSGTAAANLHPAVLEASHAGVPLLVLSADRPHELRGTGANQTTDQVRLFGTAVRWFAEIPAPRHPADSAASWQAVAVRALTTAVGELTGQPGPVHVNVAFDEPLVPGGSGDDDDADPDGGGLRLAGDLPLTLVSGASTPEPLYIRDGPRTVVVAGDGAGWTPRWLAESAGWPLLAEPSSGARSGPNAVGPYRLLLEDPVLGPRIERVVVYGRPTVSRQVTRLLARRDLEVIVVSRRADWPDVAGTAARVVPAVVPPVLRGAGRSAWRRDGGPWLTAWREASAAASQALADILDERPGAGHMSGLLAARQVAEALGPGQLLLAGSSKPIRDLDLAAPPFDDVLDLDAAGRVVDADQTRVVLANRGLSGIDGTISTACGLALARSDDGGELPVRALVGDLTFLHDVGGLLVGPPERRPHVQLVVVDDAGGGVFEMLEHGERAQRGAVEAVTFERVFATPHGADLAALCAAFGAGYRLAEDAPSLRAALEDPPPGVSVVHVPIDRSGHRELDERVRAAVRDAVAAQLSP